MKKLILISLLALVGCSDKQHYQQAVLTQMQTEKDVKDYKIDPERISRCVVDVSSQNMPGLFLFDPRRKTAYQNYTKMVAIGTTKLTQQSLAELRTTFGSAKALANAHNNYTESVMNCISTMISETESSLKK
jgi:hypothetical protein